LPLPLPRRSSSSISFRRRSSPVRSRSSGGSRRDNARNAASTCQLARQLVRSAVLRSSRYVTAAASRRWCTGSIVRNAGRNNSLLLKTSSCLCGAGRIEPDCSLHPVSYIICRSSTDLGRYTNPLNHWLIK
jgi:hypothetical protein